MVESKKVVNWLNTKKITPAQLIAILTGIVIFTLFETKIFDNWGDGVKVCIYVGAMGVSVLLGFQFVDIKKFATAAKTVFLDPKLTLWQKVQALANLVVPILAEMNEAFDMLNIQQFIVNEKPVEVPKPETDSG